MDTSLPTDPINKRNRATAAASGDTLAMPNFWYDERKLKVLGMGTSLPGPPVPTAKLLRRIEKRFGVDLSRRGTALAGRLRIDTRHICRDFESRHESPREGNSNPDLAAAAVRAALEDAKLQVCDLDYLIGHTTSPARLLPPNVAMVADRLKFAGPYVELRQACIGFANALLVAQGIASGSRPVGAVAIVGSETGSVFFDPQRAAEDPGPASESRNDGRRCCGDHSWPRRCPTRRAHYQPFLRSDGSRAPARINNNCRRFRPCVCGRRRN
jgi:hypothetical protein